MEEVLENKETTKLNTRLLSPDFDCDDSINFNEISSNFTRHELTLRIIFACIIKYGRKRGLEILLQKVEESNKQFDANEEKSSIKNNSFKHLSMMYFWSHMVDYSINYIKARHSLQSASSHEHPAAPTLDFNTFKALSPQLFNEDHLFDYYSLALITDPASQVNMTLPDKKPLPSVLLDEESKRPMMKPCTDSTSLDTQLSSSVSDEDFMTQLYRGTVSSWGHESVLRVIYIHIYSEGRHRDTFRQVMSLLKPVQKEHQHMTATYFLCHMMTLAISKYKTSRNIPGQVSTGSPTYFPFEQFIALKQNERIRDSQLILEYYSLDLLDMGTSKNSFVLPDLKHLPNNAPS